MLNFTAFSNEMSFSIFIFLGRQLKLEGDNFRQKLNTQPLFDDWIARVKGRNITITVRLFTFEKRQKDV